jgi:hypothetical protein
MFLERNREDKFSEPYPSSQFNLLKYINLLLDSVYIVCMYLWSLA